MRRIKYFNRVICFLLFTFLFSLSLTANANDLAALHLKSLTKILLDSNALHQSNKLSALNVSDKAKARLAAMHQLLRDDSSAVLTVMFSKRVVQSMPKDALLYLEKPVENIKGTFSALCVYGATPSMRYMLTIDKNKTYEINFLSTPAKLPQSGDTVIIPHAFLVPNIKGDNSTVSHLLIPNDRNDNGLVQIGITPPYRTTGDFKTLALLVNFQDAPTNKPYTVDNVKTALKSVNDYFYETSYQKTTITGDVAGWYTVPYNSTASCDSIKDGIVSSATAQAQAAGINVSAYNRRIFIFPRTSVCGWAGLGYLGGGDTWGTTWSNGNLSLQVLGHELGHNFGLYHAHALTCTTGTITGTCNYGDGSNSAMYGDTADLMGNRFPGHLNAAEKETLGWLDNTGFPAITTVTQNGTFTLEPYETYTSNVKSIRIPKTSPVNLTSKYYYLEYRQPIGFDGGINTGLSNGLVLHEGVRGGTGNDSYMLDATPDGGNFWNAALTPGTSFNDPDAPGGGVTISVNAVDTTKASFTVTFGNTSTCVRAAPTLSIAPNTTQWVNPGSSAAYVISLKNNDSLACGNSTFNFSSLPVAGVSAIVGSNSLSVAPGATVTANLQVQSMATTASGVYIIQVNGYNEASPTMKGSAEANFGVQAVCVRANPTLSFAPTTQTGPQGGRVSYNLTLTNNDNATCGSSTFNLLSNIPTGIVGGLNQNTVSVAPGANVNLTLNANAPLTTSAGTYTLTANASNANSATYVASASVNYVLTAICVRANPTVTMTPNSQTGDAGGNVNYKISVKNNDSAICTNATFNLSSILPSGLTGTLNASSLHLAPSSQGEATLNVKSETATPSASYTITANAVNAEATSFLGTAIGSYVVTSSCKQNAPTLSISPLTQKITGLMPVNYTVTLINNDSSVCAARIFNIATNSSSPFVSATMNPGSIQVLPGKSGTAIMTLMPLTGITDGTYIGTAITEGVISQAVNLVYQKVIPLALDLSSDKTRYVRKSKQYYANLSASTKLNGTPLTNVPLVATMTYPNGQTQSLTTDSGSGTRVFQQVIQRSSQVGFYKFTVTGTYDNQKVSKAIQFEVR